MKKSGLKEEASMVKEFFKKRWVLIGSAIALVAVVVLVIVLSSTAGPGADQANDNMAQSGQTDPGADAANDNGAASPGQTVPGTASDSGTAPDGQTDAGTAGDNEAAPDGQTDAGAAGDGEAAPPGQTDTGAADDGGTPPAKQVNLNPIKDTITAPAGQTGFSIDLRVNETEPYAGIEFALTISDERALVFASFEPGISGAAAAPFVTDDGKHYFGFYAGSNAFDAGDALAGTLTFTNFTGDEPLTVTVVQMNVVRLDANNKAITTEKDSPAYVFTVQR